MALIRQLNEKSVPERVHGEASCTYATFHIGGKPYLQIDTYGSADRENSGSKSQSIQIDEASAKKLHALLKAHFELQ